MNLIEAFARNNIFVDIEFDTQFWSDQADYGMFAVVSFHLVPTDGLSEIADRIRKKRGFLPMHAMDEILDDKCDQNGWYEFRLSLNDYTDTHLDTAIEFWPENSDSPDNENVYYIDLSESDQEAIYNILDEQFERYIHKSCADLLAEARIEMEGVD